MQTLWNENVPIPYKEYRLELLTDLYPAHCRCSGTSQIIWFWSRICLVCFFYIAITQTRLRISWSPKPRRWPQWNTCTEVHPSGYRFSSQTGMQLCLNDYIFVDAMGGCNIPTNNSTYPANQSQFTNVVNFVGRSNQSNYSIMHLIMPSISCSWFAITQEGVCIGFLISLHAWSSTILCFPNYWATFRSRVCRCNIQWRLIGHVFLPT